MAPEGFNFEWARVTPGGGDRATVTHRDGPSHRAIDSVVELNCFAIESLDAWINYIYKKSQCRHRDSAELSSPT